MNGLGKLVIFAVAVMTLGSAAAVYFTPPSPQEARRRRKAEAQRLVDQVTQATWDYFHDRGEFPPGEGVGTWTLVRALRGPSSGGAPYMVFVDAMLTPEGHLRNPVSPHASVLCYRNNRVHPNRLYPGHNAGSFDLWCWSPDGVEDGINNWDSTVVPAP